MAWSDVVDALVEKIAAVDGVDDVARVPFVAGAEIGPNATVVALTPAGRRTEAGGDPMRVWSQPLVVLRFVDFSSASLREASDAITAATLAIDDALGASITLDGLVTYAGPVTWGESLAYEIPPESGAIFAGQAGTLEIVEAGIGQRSA